MWFVRAVSDGADDLSPVGLWHARCKEDNEKVHDQGCVLGPSPVEVLDEIAIHQRPCGSS